MVKVDVSAEVYRALENNAKSRGETVDQLVEKLLAQTIKEYPTFFKEVIR